MRVGRFLFSFTEEAYIWEFDIFISFQWNGEEAEIISIRQHNGANNRKKVEKSDDERSGTKIETKEKRIRNESQKQLQLQLLY